jgi:hypothetical protein
MEITADFIKSVIGQKHLNYQLTVDIAEKLKVHAEGRVPETLIFDRRPSEPDAIKDYRRKIYVPITKNPISKVINSLEKIRRSSDWVIKYGQSLTSIRQGEELETYCEKHYPIHNSLTNWMFAEGMKNYLLDANGLVAVVPFEMPNGTSDYVKPIAQFYESKQVIAFVEGEYAVIQSYDKSVVKNARGNVVNTNGDIYLIITATEYYKFEQINQKRDLQQTEIYKHNIGKLPVFRVGGLFSKRLNNSTIYDSRISSMVSSLDEASREYSDLQAEILQHIHSEKYIYTNTECNNCKGIGTILKDGTQSECPICKGSGNMLSISNYNTYLIKAGTVGENALPTPPIGYVQKSTEIAKLQDERVRRHIYDSLATLNMEFLAETPLNQSGTAKEVDKDELNNFVNSIAEDVVNIMDNVYFYICEYRYNVLIQDVEKRKSLLPSVNVPTKYDLLGSNYLLLELNSAKTSGISPVIKKALEIEYAKKKFNTMPEISEYSQLTFELDPLYGLNEDEKMTRKSNGGITDIDYIISCNINQFVQRAMSEDELFFDKDFAGHTEKMKQYASEIQKQLTPIVEVIPINNNGL